MLTGGNAISSLRFVLYMHQCFVYMTAPIRLLSIRNRSVHHLQKRIKKIAEFEGTAHAESCSHTVSLICGMATMMIYSGITMDYLMGFFRILHEYGCIALHVSTPRRHMKMFHDAPLRYRCLTGNIQYKSEYNPIKSGLETEALGRSEKRQKCPTHRDVRKVFGSVR
jgi:hypothetical protein